MIFQDSKIAHKYLDGLKGIELGPSKHNPFNIKDCIFVDQYQPQSTHAYGLEQLRLCNDIQKIDIIADASCLPFEDNSLDYVLSSHLLEHIWDPIFCIKEWLRVLKQEGFIYCIVPHKERGLESDKSRPITRLEEWIDRNKHPELNPKRDDHHSVFLPENLKELFEYCNTEVIELLPIDDKVFNGICIIVRKND